MATQSKFDDAKGSSSSGNSGQMAKVITKLLGDIVNTLQQHGDLATNRPEKRIKVVASATELVSNSTAALEKWETIRSTFEKALGVAVQAFADHKFFEEPEKGDMKKFATDTFDRLLLAFVNSSTFTGAGAHPDLGAIANQVTSHNVTKTDFSHLTRMNDEAIQDPNIRELISRVAGKIGMAKPDARDEHPHPSHKLVLRQVCYRLNSLNNGNVQEIVKFLLKSLDNQSAQTPENKRVWAALGLDPFMDEVGELGGLVSAFITCVSDKLVKQDSDDDKPALDVSKVGSAGVSASKKKNNKKRKNKSDNKVSVKQTRALPPDDRAGVAKKRTENEIRSAKDQGSEILHGPSGKSYTENERLIDAVAYAERQSRFVCVHENPCHKCHDRLKVTRTNGKAGVICGKRHYGKGEATKEEQAEAAEKLQQFFANRGGTGSGNSSSNSTVRSNTTSAAKTKASFDFGKMTPALVQDAITQNKQGVRAAILMAQELLEQAETEARDA